jgi:hypothetical protein
VGNPVDQFSADEWRRPGSAEYFTAYLKLRLVRQMEPYIDRISIFVQSMARAVNSLIIALDQEIQLPCQPVGSRLRCGGDKALYI